MLTTGLLANSKTGRDLYVCLSLYTVGPQTTGGEAIRVKVYASSRCSNSVERRRAALPLKANKDKNNKTKK